MATKIKLRNVRLSFPDVFTAKSVGDDDKPAFSASFIIPPDHPQIDEINAAIEAEAKTKWGAKSGDIVKALRKTDKVCLHDGDTKPYEGYSGNLFISARNAVRPKLKALNGRDDLQESDGVLYSGCWVVAILEIWPQDHKKHGKRINASLLGVQFLRDDAAFSGGSSASDDDFDDLGDGADDLAG